MRNTASVSAESISFRYLPHVPGIEILDAQNTARHWKWLNTAFGLAVPITWHCEVRYRRRLEEVGAGTVFCTSPGEIHATARVVRAGAFHAILIDPIAFESYVAEHDVPASRADWRKTVAKVTPALSSRITTMLGLAFPETDAMLAQSSAVSLFEVLVQELVDAGRLVRGKAISATAAARIRECLHSEDATTLDLQGLAERVGLSRFQVLRTFQRQYGLPPHAYQLCWRVAHARTLLHAGYSSAEASARCGFADQSHFGRHFKRLVGVTPAQYACTSGQTRHSRRGNDLQDPYSGLTVLSRT